VQVSVPYERASAGSGGARTRGKGKRRRKTSSNRKQQQQPEKRLLAARTNLAKHVLELVRRAQILALAVKNLGAAAGGDVGVRVAHVQRA
jgi:hypothetical protein